MISIMMQALQQQMAELESKLGQARTDSKAQVKGHNTGKKELEVSSHLPPSPPPPRTRFAKWPVCTNDVNKRMKAASRAVS